jgi:hypothetical protein
VIKEVLMGGFYFPNNEAAQVRADILARGKVKADEAFDRVLAEGGTRDEADDAWTAVMDEAHAQADTE